MDSEISKTKGRNFEPCYIKEKNDFSKFEKKKLRNNNLSLDKLICFKMKNRNVINENLSYLNKIIDRTFYSSQNRNKTIDLPLYNISDLSNCQKTENMENKRNNSSINIKRKKMDNKKINKTNNQAQEYINKNYNKVFGEEKYENINKTLKIYYQIYKMKKKIYDSQKYDLMNRPKIYVKEPQIFNDYNDISISLKRKYNKLKKPYKRNFSNLNICNTTINDNKKNQKLNCLNLNKRKYSNLKCMSINLLNDYYTGKEIENYKNSFKQNNLKLLFKKCVNNKK